MPSRCLGAQQPMPAREIAVAGGHNVLIFGSVTNCGATYQ